MEFIRIFKMFCWSVDIDIAEYCGTEIYWHDM